MKKNLLVCIKLASALFHHKTVPFRKQLEHSTKSKLCVGFPQTSDDDLAIESIPEDFKILMDIAVTFTACYRVFYRKCCSCFFCF